MNIDERIEALTQTVELLAHHSETTDKHLNQMANHSQAVDKRLDRIAEFLDRLAHIVEVHERRLSKLEGD